MSAAVLALVGMLMSTYLYLYKLGLIGTLACGTGGCETVQLSAYSRFLGIEVPLIGLVGYGAIFVVALLGLQPRFHRAQWPGRALIGLAVVGLVFTGHLTYLELFVIHAVCRWCVGSAVIILVLFLLSVADARRPRPA